MHILVCLRMQFLQKSHSQTAKQSETSLFIKKKNALLQTSFKPLSANTSYRDSSYSIYRKSCLKHIIIYIYIYVNLNYLFCKCHPVVLATSFKASFHICTLFRFFLKRISCSSKALAKVFL